MYCGRCGKQIADNQNYCPYCGSSTSNANNSSSDFNLSSYVNNPSYSYANEPVKNYNLFSAYKEMFKKYAKFDGRSRRSEYWYAGLANFIIMMVAYIILFVPMITDLVNYGEPTETTAAIMAVSGLVLMIYAFAVMIPCLALGVRRLHDIGKSGWFMLISLIPYVGSIILIVFMATDSQSGPNQYGPNPKGM